MIHVTVTRQLNNNREEVKRAKVLVQDKEGGKTPYTESQVQFKSRHPELGQCSPTGKGPQNPYVLTAGIGTCGDSHFPLTDSEM